MVGYETFSIENNSSLRQTLCKHRNISTIATATVATTVAVHITFNITSATTTTIIVTITTTNNTIIINTTTTSINASTTTFIYQTDSKY